ncbi:uncharacterized protein LOC144635641 [Oculina patagonica]
MDFSVVYLLLVIIAFSTAKTTKQLEAKFTCNGQLSFYVDVSNELLVSSHSSNIASNYTLKPGSEVVSVRCRNFLSKPWLIGSVSNGLVTDTRWKCFSLPKNLTVTGLTWAKPNTDDSQWAQAVANYSNPEKIPNIKDEALWISTAVQGHSRLFCRRRLSDLSPKQANSLSKGMFQATIDNVNHALHHHPRSQHEVSDVTQCLKKCQDDFHCLSFNFQHKSILPTRKCELNGATKGQDPPNYVRRPGYTYYESAE